MKDSGIEWIGEIPENWDTIRVKHLATEKDTLFLDGDWINSDVIVDEGIRYLTSGNVGEGVYKEQGKGYISEETFNKLNCLTVYPGDLMISRLNEPVGRCCIVPEGEEYYVVAVDNVILRPNHNFHKKYLLYCMNTTGYARAALMAASGTTMQRISRTSLGNMAVPVASYEEQSRIADYLDKKCSEIDAIIAAKEKTNELLKERRQSIIYEAVTKGLDPTVPMKDSGIEWIGEIPESWEIERLKYHIEFNPATGIPEYEDDQQVSFLPMECLRRGTHTSQVVDYEKVKKGYVIFQDNDILMAKVTPCLENGNIAIAQGLIDGIGFGSTEINVIRCTSIHREYMFYMLQCKTYIDRAVVDMYGVAGLKRLNPSFIPNTKYPIPSSAEQERIAEYLNRVCGEFDALIAVNNVTIEKLKEYRQSIIYEAVTGKVEV